MTSKEKLNKIIESCDYLEFPDYYSNLIDELGKLEKYRELFESISKSDKELEYSGEELVRYYKIIES